MAGSLAWARQQGARCGMGTRAAWVTYTATRKTEAQWAPGHGEQWVHGREAKGSMGARR